MAIKVQGDTVIYDDKVVRVSAANTVSRPLVPQVGMIRYNTTDQTFEGYSDAGWGPIGGGAAAGGAILLNTPTITTSYSLEANTNGLSVGPITIANGVSVSVQSNRRWVIV